jgi:outer membrane protein assembly factor BamA
MPAGTAQMFSRLRNAARSSLLAGACWLACAAAAAQNTPTFVKGKVTVTGLPTPQLQRAITSAIGRAKDSAAVQKAVAQSVATLQAEGYPTAKLAALKNGPSGMQFAYEPGAYYYLENLAIKGLLLPELDAAGLTLPAPPKRMPFSWLRIQRGMLAVLYQYEAQGRPFAAFNTPQVAYCPAGRANPNDTIAVTVRYDFNPGPLVTIDSLVPVGAIREKPAFVQSVVKLKPGDPYDQTAIDAIPQLLNNTPYYQDAKKPDVRFTESQGKTCAVVRVPVAHRRSNRFDLVLGFLPPQGNDNRFRFTGLLDLQLVSALRLGEILNLRYEELPSATNSNTGSRRMDLRYMHPNLFGTAFRAELKFDLMQQDTSWLTRNFEPTVYYAFTPQLSVRAYYRNRFSSLLSISPQLRVTKFPPPPVLDGRSDALGIGAVYDNLDYKPNPRKGLSLAADFGWGGKTIQRTPGLDSLDYSRIVLNQSRTEARLDVAWYKQVRPRQVLVLAGRSYWLGLNEYLQNDLAFLGGARSLRGFNENAFLASLYAVGTVEYRLLLEQNSYIGLLFDYAYVERRVLDVRNVQHPFGVGFALQVQTGPGVVTVSYAVGQTEGISFQPARGRIHIGFVATF